MAKLIPGARATRMELLALRRRKALAEKGHNLLKEKRDALIMEFFSVLGEVRKLRGEVNAFLKDAFSSLVEAKMAMGALKVWELAAGVLADLEISVDSRNIMGVTVPILNLVETSTKTNNEEVSEGESKADSIGGGGFAGSIDASVKLDEAAGVFQSTIEKMVKLAETEETVRRLAEEIESTKRRVNALRFIIIPRVDATIRFIELALEERAREDLFRMKRIKKILEKKTAEN